MVLERHPDRNVFGSQGARQLPAVVVGGNAGVMAGGALLLYLRLMDPRIRVTSILADTGILALLLAQLGLRLTIFNLFPFIRLVHMISAPVRRLWRPGPLMVRSRRTAPLPPRPAPAAKSGPTRAPGARPQPAE